MGRARLVVLVLLVLAATPIAAERSAQQEPSDTGTPRPQIASLYPNPVADDDAGEFVALSVPPETNLGAYALADDEASTRLPAVNVSGRVVFSTAPNRTAQLVDSPVRHLRSLALSNSGESVRLLHNGTTVDTLTYEGAPEGELRTAASDTAWRPLGATNFSVTTAGAGTVRPFVLPDAPDAATDFLRGADDRILLAGYTLTAERVGDALVAARERDVTVRVLVDGAPVGGFPRRQARLLDRLSQAGIEVRVVGGEAARYEFHHPKYAVVDDRALVTTENWKPAGTGGTSSRGWGVITDQRRIVSALERTFRADASARGAITWQQFKPSVSLTETNATRESYPTRIDPATVTVDSSRLLVAPDNAERAVVGLIENATTSLAIEQVSIGSRHSPFLQATLDAARRGVRVRVLLSGAWYTREENDRLVTWLNERASAENLPLTARLADPRGRFEKIHAKGVIVDGDQVLLGSLNWNNNSARDNREVALVLDGREVGAYFQQVFDADWRTRTPVTVGYLVAIGVVTAGILLVARRLRFGGDTVGVSAGDDDRLTDT